MTQTFKKKVIVASLASAFVLIGAGAVSVPAIGNVSQAAAAVATTTTVGLRVDSDKDALSATRRTLNLGVLGLDSSGNVDVYGEAGGSVIIAEVSSVLGTVNSGAATPLTATGGAFAASANYITLSQGSGLANVTYPAAVSGTDTVTVRLFERRKDAGGNAVTTLIGTQTVQTAVVAGSATTGVLHISAFAQGTDTTSTAAAATPTPANEGADDGIGVSGRVVAGTSGSTLTIKAFAVAADRTYTLDTNASGAVTVTLTGVNTLTDAKGGNRAQATDTYTLTGTMSAGVATITWPANVTKAGVYKMVASLGTATSVPSKVLDNVDTRDYIHVVPSTVPAKLSLSVNRSIVSNEADATSNAAAAAAHDGYDMRPVVTAALLDTYGNKIDPTGYAGATVKVTDANSKVSDFNVTIAGGANAGTATLTTAGLSVGTGSLSASIANNANIAASAATPLKIVSNVNQLTTTADGASGGYIVPNAVQTAGSAIASFLLAGIGVDANNNGVGAGAELNTLTAANRLTIKSMTPNADGTYDSVTVGVTNGVPDTVGALFKKTLTNGNAKTNGFLVSDPDGSYADYLIIPATGSAVAVNAASPSTAYLKDFQGNVVTTANATRNANGTYTLTIDAARLSMTDANGNVGSTGAATATSVKGVASSTVTTVGTAGQAITVAYPAGTVGPDTVTINFAQPGVNPLTLTVNLVGASTLSQFTSVVASAEIPVNAVVPLTILPQDASGKNMSLADGFTVTYPTGVTVKTANGGALASGTNVGANSGVTTLQVVAGSVAGSYKITVANTAGTISKDITYTVKQYATSTPVAGDTGGATVTGPITAQTISAGVTPATADLGRQGSVFVVGIVPNGGAFFMDANSNWTQFKDCATAPAFSTGSLTALTSIPVVKTAIDLTALKGVDFYTGYGIGGVLSAPGTACTSMIANGTYSKVYTIK